MHRTSKYIYVNIVTAIAVTMFFSCKNNFKEVQKIGILDSAPLTIAEDINTKYTDSGRIKSVLLSPKMLNYSNRDYAFYEFPDGIDLTLYDDKQQKSKVKSDYAIMYQETDLIDLRGNVVLATHNADTLFSEQLFYDQKNEWIFTNAPVTFKTKDQIIKGNGFDSNKNFTNAHVIEITGHMYLNE
ncbi:MAG: LPS export ABC transporter periplasmic protein LptC [Flavobacteriaceae bacterium]|nr:LPS export ABC transporter periplasmic protein LptC [Flavobacteriaceae bacterium]